LAPVILAYWSNRTERDNYHWHHRLFAEAYEQNAQFKQIWDATPKLSADGPHCFVPSRETLFRPVNAFHCLIVESAQYPVLKLTHKLDHHLAVSGTAYRWMCEHVQHDVPVPQ
jgi:Capsular polysaccharide synthesis protein